MAVRPLNSNEIFQHTLVSDIQSGIEISDSGIITGSLKSLSDWIWDPYSFETGVIKDAPYHFIALDLSDNNYDEQLTSVVVRNSSYPNEGIEIINRVSKQVLIEVRSAHDSIEIIQTNMLDRTYTQVLSLSEIVLL